MLFDKDKSGYIEAREIREVTTTMGMPLSLEELEDFMKMADQNGDGRLDYNEFVKAMTKF
jgi:calmodulin